MRLPERQQKRRSKRTPIPFIDAYGTSVLKVPLDDDANNFALVDEADYQRLFDSGVTPNWFLNGDGKGRVYVRAGSWRDGKASVIQIARAILRAEGRRVVHYINSDRLDLRSNNLRLSKCRGISAQQPNSKLP